MVTIQLDECTLKDYSIKLDKIFAKYNYLMNLSQELKRLNQQIILFIEPSIKSTSNTNFLYFIEPQKDNFFKHISEILQSNFDYINADFKIDEYNKELTLNNNDWQYSKATLYLITQTNDIKNDLNQVVYDNFQQSSIQDLQRKIHQVYLKHATTLTINHFCLLCKINNLTNTNNKFKKFIAEFNHNFSLLERNM